MAFNAPLLGYNTNVRHKGKLYHIQTEDSGISRPHVVTHLFTDGGRIVASKKTSYGEHVGMEKLAEHVKKLMQAQHKAMFIALRDGVYDEDAPKAGAASAPVPPAAAPAKSKEPDSPPASEPKAQPGAAEGPSDKPSEPSQGLPGQVGAAKRPSARPANRPSASAKPSTKAPSAPSDKPLIQPGAERKPSGRPSARPRPAAASPSLRAVPEPRIAVKKPPRDSVYQGTQAAARVTERSKAPSTPRERVSIFGSDLLSEKSLDEVVLSYLASDDDY